MFKKWLKVFSQCDLFKGINPEELNLVFNCLKPKVSNYEKNDWVAVAGEKFTGLGVVLAGEVVVVKENAAGNRVIIAVNTPGEMFGEMAAFSGEGVWPVSVTARTACTVMFLPAGKIVGNCEMLCASHRLLVTNLLEIVSHKALMLHRKVEYLAIKSLRGKISTFLLENYKKMGKPTFLLPLKRNELADFLNVSRPSLSREMCRLRDEGVIDFHRESIKIREVNALRNMAE
ncbi:Crp/Fnr family transcriptional regulator [Pelotomaculum propionicicum]|uniref:Cyclic AMP receptor protein n=1 Tax=Pelotomaculum propionicicum TaxID=258475 RepID=A0A4Y7RYE8_9FIRM|nr:Crp/Fnr family transcriptional regulator [Pelotomaculum propionicicum]NLI13563.1 Crp/Fnr family transcriptional regulator [Peptococcaceae bacterium]TEB13756.1 Cyclic AMP receptor protein [Pelotomaculum propionicicum]